MTKWAPNRNLEPWAIEVKKVLIERGMTQRDLAQTLRRHPPDISSTLTGTYYSPVIKEEICTYLGIGGAERREVVSG